MRTPSHVLLMLLTALTLARPVSADPIPIMGGQLQMTGTTGTLLLIGERGFTLSAGVTATDGIFRPWLNCNLFAAPCVAGAPIDMSAAWVGTSLRSSTATLDGETFTQVGGLISPSQASVTFTGSVTAPPLDMETATLVAPFLFRGTFTPGGSIQEMLFGHGTVTLSLLRAFGGQTGLPPVWTYTSAEYEFDPIPEPATILLTGAGLLGLARLRQRSPRT